MLNGTRIELTILSNLHPQTVSSVSHKWSRFNQSSMSDDEARKVFDDYFAVFPCAILPLNAKGFDMGCGSNRWARRVAPKVGNLHCIDPSGAIDVEPANLIGLENVTIQREFVGSSKLSFGSYDFGFELGVMHLCLTLPWQFDHAFRC
jgi:hypothetical protein